MSSQINILPPIVPPVVANFGWYYGLSPQRLPEDVYQENLITYPPGRTTLGGGSSLTLPASSVPSSFGTLVQLQAQFEAQGTIVLNTFSTNRATVNYTGLGVVGGFPSFTGCSGGTGTYGLGTAIYDPRFYVDDMPLLNLITFDAIDHQNLGLPVTVTPSGVTIISYQWDFGNGEVGFGPFSSTTYTYNQPSPSIQAALTVIDSLGRSFSCAQRLNLKFLTPVSGTILRERQSNAGYR